MENCVFKPNTNSKSGFQSHANYTNLLANETKARLTMGQNEGMVQSTQKFMKI